MHNDTKQKNKYSCNWNKFACTNITIHVKTKCISFYEAANFKLCILNTCKNTRRILLTMKITFKESTEYSFNYHSTVHKLTGFQIKLLQPCISSFGDEAWCYTVWRIYATNPQADSPDHPSCKYNCFYYFNGNHVTRKDRIICLNPSSLNFQFGRRRSFTIHCSKSLMSHISTMYYFIFSFDLIWLQNLITVNIQKVRCMNLSVNYLLILLYSRGQNIKLVYSGNSTYFSS